MPRKASVPASCSSMPPASLLTALPLSVTRPSPQAIVRARIDNPKMRERDLAAQLGISVSAVEKHVTKALRIVSIRLQEIDERQPATTRSFR